jgi:spore germination cell wall hydrolase CwlJ-like protein
MHRIRRLYEITQASACWLAVHRRQIRLSVFGATVGLLLLLIDAAEGGLTREIGCLAKNIYFEARLEPEDGRRAVAHVVLNRVVDSRWPDSPCAVVTQGHPEAGALCQFSWYCDGRSNRPRRDESWRDAKRLAHRVYWGRSQDPTGGALWYHADYVLPKWRHALRRGPKIGRHIFYHDPLPPVGPEKRSI